MGAAELEGFSVPKVRIRGIKASDTVMNPPKLSFACAGFHATRFSRRHLLKETVKITVAQDLLPLLADIAGKQQEHFICISLNGANEVAKLDTGSGTVVARINTGSRPRSMAISPDGTALYVVNYDSNTVTKLRASGMSIVQTIGVGSHPIGITYEPSTHRVWVACYSGEILVFGA